MTVAIGVAATKPLCTRRQIYTVSYHSMTSPAHLLKHLYATYLIVK